MTDNEALDAGPAGPDVLQAWINRVWHLWSSDAGAHYATRGGRLTKEQERAGCERTLAADTPEALAECLRSQPDTPTATARG